MFINLCKPINRFSKVSLGSWELALSDGLKGGKIKNPKRKKRRDMIENGEGERWVEV